MNRKRAAKQTMIGGIAAAPVPTTKPADQRWSVTLSDDKTEELSTAEVVALYAVGKIRNDTLIWKDGMFRWLPPFEIPEIAQELRARGFQEGDRARAAPRPPPAAAPAVMIKDDDDEEPTRAFDGAQPPPAPRGRMSSDGWWHEPGLADAADDEETRALATDRARELLKSRPGPVALGDLEDEEITRAISSTFAESRRISDVPPVPDTERPRLPPPAIPPAPSPARVPVSTDFDDDEVTRAMEPPAAVEKGKGVAPTVPDLLEGAKGVGLAAPSLEQLRYEERQAPRRRPGRWLLAALALAVLLCVGLVLVYKYQKPASLHESLRALLPAAVTQQFDNIANALPGGPAPETTTPDTAPSQQLPPPQSEPAGAEAEPSETFDRVAAARTLGGIAQSLDQCKTPAGPTGTGRVQVTYNPSGEAVEATVSEEFANTPVGTCLVKLFKDTRVPPFSGAPVTVGKTFTVP